METKIIEQINLITRGTAEIISIEELNDKLEYSYKHKKPLNIKAGFDPTSKDIHLGHVVLLRKLRQFQELGHNVLFLIGDFTAQIGDPSGRNEARPQMTKEEVLKNALTYKKQVFKVLDRKKTRVVFNSQWLGKMSSAQLLKLTSFSSVAQLLARADFKARYEQQKEISILEFIYPLLQAYDSYVLKADVEIGGSDQKFNLLMGRQLQKAFGQAQQVIITTPLLEGIDSVNKMSKSQGNYIGIDEGTKDIFGKIMSISDELMLRYYELLTCQDLQKIKQLHPMEAKLNLAQNIVQEFCGLKSALQARKEFERVFRKGEPPQDIITYEFDQDKRYDLAQILTETMICASGNQAKRIIREGGVSFNGVKMTDYKNWQIKEGILKIGKRRFIKFISLKSPQT